MAKTYWSGSAEEAYSKPNGKWFRSIDNYIKEPSLREDARSYNDFIMWFRHLSSQEQETIIASAPWIEEILPWEPRVIATRLVEPVKTDLATLYTIVTKLLIAGVKL